MTFLSRLFRKTPPTPANVMYIRPIEGGEYQLTLPSEGDMVIEVKNKSKALLFINCEHIITYDHGGLMVVWDSPEPIPMIFRGKVVRA